MRTILLSLALVMLSALPVVASLEVPDPFFDEGRIWVYDMPYRGEAIIFGCANQPLIEVPNRMVREMLDLEGPVVQVRNLSPDEPLALRICAFAATVFANNPRMARRYP